MSSSVHLIFLSLFSYLSTLRAFLRNALENHETTLPSRRQTPHTHWPLRAGVQNGATPPVVGLCFYNSVGLCFYIGTTVVRRPGMS